MQPVIIMDSRSAKERGELDLSGHSAEDGRRPETLLEGYPLESAQVAASKSAAILLPILMDVSQ